MVQTAAAATETLVTTSVARSSSQRKQAGNEAAVVAFLQLLLAVAFAALLVALAPLLGISVKAAPGAGGAPPVWPAYGLGTAWQDFRSLLSFAMGALICCLLSGGLESLGLGDLGGCGPDEAEEDADADEAHDADGAAQDCKAQLCAYTL